ncbi:MAG: hypothetical protein ABSE16_03885 [Verrucomicrobiota bacterium]
MKAKSCSPTCTNLSDLVRASLATTALVNGTNYFCDPKWTNYPSTVFEYDNNATAYYYSGTSGWGSTIASIPSVMLNSSVSVGSLQVTITPAAAIPPGRTGRWRAAHGRTPQMGNVRYY